MARLFGTDGVRGIANGKLNADLAYQMGRAGAYCLTNAVHKAKILIGRDTRISGDMLESALVAGVCSAGAEAVVAGVIPTPAVAYLTKHLGCDAGAMISASHNPVEYNGIKFFSMDGFKLADSIEDRIEALIATGGREIPAPSGMEIGRRVRHKNAQREYADHIASLAKMPLDGLVIVLDCANGASSAVAPELFKRLGAKVHACYHMPDGTNINENCGSTHPESLATQVREIGADVGLAFDGDADRLIAVDENGAILNGDQVMTICAIDLKNEGKLAHDTVVATVMSNMGMELALKREGIRLLRSDVGDRYVLEKMRQEGCNFGGEQSGHVIFLDESTTGDGILSGLHLVSVMKKRGMKLSQLARVISILPQVLVNARVSESKKHFYAEDEQICREIDLLEQRMAGTGRVLIRTSGTEPLVRVMIEGEDSGQITEHAVRLASLIEQQLG